MDFSAAWPIIFQLGNLWVFFTYFCKARFCLTYFLKYDLGSIGLKLTVGPFLTDIWCPFTLLVLSHMLFQVEKFYSQLFTSVFFSKFSYLGRDIFLSRVLYLWFSFSVFYQLKKFFSQIARSSNVLPIKSASGKKVNSNRVPRLTPCLPPGQFWSTVTCHTDVVMTHIY